MTRRRLVVTASAAVLLVLSVLVVLAVAGVTQTSYGRERVRALVMRYAERVEGTVYIGRLSGGLFTGVTIDSLELRDPNDSLVVATGPVTIQYDPRDFLDRRVLLRYVEVQRPTLHLGRYPDGSWNWRRMFPDGGPKRKRTERGFGDFVVIDSMVVHRGTLTLTMPWAPDDSLKGARRDSAVAFNVARADRDIRRGADTLVRTWRWTNAEAASSYVRLADTDSIGRFYDVSKLDMDESDPPMKLRNLRGGFRHLGDSIWLDIPHFDLPGSTGRATGKVVWGSDLPTRYDVRVRGDSISLADVAWVYPTLPTTGGGRMNLHILTDPKKLTVMNYAIERMDVRSTGSRLLGDMTFAVGGPVLVVKDVAMQARPMDFALIRVLNGKDFPYPWAGTITGDVRARGGPLNRFHVDSARVVFRDTNVPGATTSGSARGHLDILFPAFTKFLGLRVAIDRLDLRTLQFLNPDFPRVRGLVSGYATLDSSWLDVRFRDASLAHLDGDLEPSRATGSGRITYGDEFLTYELDLETAPLALTTIAASYPLSPLRGSVTGPLRVRGTAEDLEVQTTLTGAAGTVTVDGRFDLFAPRFAMRGTASAGALDLAGLLAPAAGAAPWPRTSLTGRATVDIAGDSLPNLTGTALLRLDRSDVDGVRLYGASAPLEFLTGVVRTDSAVIESALGTVQLAGGLGVAPGRRDSLRFTASVDSLGALRRWLAVAVERDAQVPDDTLAGSFVIDGTLQGTIATSAAPADVLDARVTMRGQELRVAETRASALRATLALTDVLRSPAGTITLAVDTATVGGVALAGAALDATVFDRERGRFSLNAASQSGPALRMAGGARLTGDTTTVSLDTMALVVGENSWKLEAPTRLVSSAAGLQLDHTRLRGDRTGWFTFAADLPMRGPVSASIAADSVPLVDIGLLLQAPVPYAGRAALALSLAGTRAAPELTMSAELADARFGTLQLDRATARGAYANQSVEGGISLFRGGRSVLSATATLPLDLAIAPIDDRRLPGNLRAQIRTDSADLSLLEALSPGVQRATGRLEAQVDVGGTWRQPQLVGRLTVADGAFTLRDAGVRLFGFNADIALAGDSLAVRRLEARTDDRRAGRASITGTASFADLTEPRVDFSLFARNFHVIHRPRLADLEVSTADGRPLRIVGAPASSRLTGGIVVTRGDIFIPELVQKDLVALEGDDVYTVVDTSLYTNRTLLPNAPPSFVRNLIVDNVSIAMGSDTWLRSSEANINLGGAVSVTTSRNERDRDRVQLALDGPLSAVRGTYRLNLGVVQRTFAIEQGSLRFFGNDPDLNPALGIDAVYTVRSNAANVSRRDVRVRVRIGGTLAQPTLTLSGDDPNLSDSDLISYLVTGQPSFEVGTTQSVNTALSLASLTLNSYLEGRFSGGLFDYVQLRSVGATQAGTANQTASNFLLNTSLGLGVQVGSRTFVSANLGLCGFRGLAGLGGSNQEFNPSDLANAAGGKVEYRLTPSISAALGIEPATQSLVCGQTSSFRSFVPTPRQLGFDLFKTWRF